MDLLRNILRWILLLGLTAFGMLYLNSTVYSLWAAGGPPTEVPNAWLHRSLVHFGFSVALITTGIFFFRALRKGYIYKGSKAWGIWIVIITISLGGPPLREFVQIDSCLDSGGKWSKKHHECQRNT